MQVVNDIVKTAAPYLRVDTLTNPFCEKVITAGVNAYDVAREYISTSPLGSVQVPTTLIGAYNQTISTAGNFIENNIYVKDVAKNVATSLKSIPTSSPNEFCKWATGHTTAASDNLQYLIKKPQVLLGVSPTAFFTKTHTDLMLTHKPTLTSSVEFDWLHLLHLITVYAIVIGVIFKVLNLIHSGLGVVLGKSTTKGSKSSAPLYLFGIETFDRSEMKPEWGITAESWYQKHIDCFHQSEENAQFVKRVYQNSGLATDEFTHLAPEITSSSPQQTISSSREESFMYIENLLSKIFTRYNIKPTDVDVLVINCSLFNPTPSHCSMAINHFKMRNDVISYAIHGMGCSASAIAINACRDALLCHPKKNPIGIVISFENLTMNFYYGKERGMLVPNALFRLGAAAMLFGREPTMLVPRGPTLNATYKLDHLVRTHLGSSDEAYRCIWQEEDKDGAKGVRLSKDVPKIAGKALTINVTKLAHLILPYHELIRFGIKMAICKLTGQKPGAPNFLTAVDHVCIHAGGRGVIDAIEKDFNFPEHITKPSREILYYYGNQSSASIWYIFKHIHPTVTRGQKVWQMTFGSGFKANSLVWKRL